MKFEFGAYSFGAAGQNLEGETITTAQAVRSLPEQIRLAEQAGLDFCGVAELPGLDRAAAPRASRGHSPAVPYSVLTRGNMPVKLLLAGLS